MKKAYKIAHKICAKKSSKLCKSGINCTQKSKKTLEKIEISTAVKNLHVRRVRCVHLFTISAYSPYVQCTILSVGISVRVSQCFLSITRQTMWKVMK